MKTTTLPLLARVRHYLNPYAADKLIYRLARTGWLIPAKPLTKRQMRYLPRWFWQIDTLFWAATDKRFRDKMELIWSTLKGQIAKPGRNEKCPCGSGRKYKKCCLGRVEG